MGEQSRTTMCSEVCLMIQASHTHTHVAIFYMLGDIERHAADKDITSVELWRTETQQDMGN